MYAPQRLLELEECPEFNNQELLTIYDSYENIIHSPDTKFCVFDSYRRQLDDRVHPPAHVRAQYYISETQDCTGVPFHCD